MIRILIEEQNHPELTCISSVEYEEIKEDLLKDAQAFCNYNGYWCVCVAIRKFPNWYLVNLDTGYLFTANSLEEYRHTLKDWGFSENLVQSVYGKQNDFENK